MKINNIAVHCGPDALPRHAARFAESVATQLAKEHTTILLHLDRSLPRENSAISVVEYLVGSFRTVDVEDMITANPEDGYLEMSLGQYEKDLSDLEDSLFTHHTRGDQFFWQERLTQLVRALTQHYAPQTSLLSLVWSVGSSLTDPFARAVLAFGESHQVSFKGDFDYPYDGEEDVRWTSCLLGADGPWALKLLEDYTVEHVTSYDVSRIVSFLQKEEAKVVKVEHLVLEGRRRYLASPLFLKVKYTGSWHCTLDFGEYVLFAEGESPQEVADKILGMIPDAWDQYVQCNVNNLPQGGFAVRSKLREMFREV